MWRALEDLYAQGVIKSIGISNFYANRMFDLFSFVRIKPMVNQVETHPHNQQIEAQNGWKNIVRKLKCRYHFEREETDYLLVKRLPQLIKNTIRQMYKLFCVGNYKVEL